MHPIRVTLSSDNDSTYPKFINEMNAWSLHVFLCTLDSQRFVCIYCYHKCSIFPINLLGYISIQQMIPHLKASFTFWEHSSMVFLFTLLPICLLLFYVYALISYRKLIWIFRILVCSIGCISQTPNLPNIDCCYKCNYLFVTFTFFILFV